MHWLDLHTLIDYKTGSHKIYWDLTWSHMITGIWQETFDICHLTCDIHICQVISCHLVLTLHLTSDLTFVNIWHLTYGDWLTIDFWPWLLTFDIEITWHDALEWYWHNPRSFSMMDSIVNAIRLSEWVMEQYGFKRY